MDQAAISARAEEFEAALSQIRRTHLGHDQTTDLRHSEIHFLMLIAKVSDKQAVTPSDIAKKMEISLSAITHHLTALENKGYISRTPSPDDKRVTLVTLSDRGKLLVDKLQAGFWKKLCGLVEFLGDDDSRELIQLLTKMTTYINQIKSVNPKEGI